MMKFTTKIIFKIFKQIILNLQILKSSEKNNYKK